MASNPDEGRRQAALEKQRKEMMEDSIRQKELLQKETERRNQSASERFTIRTEGLDEALKKSTIGLVTLDEFRKTRDEIEEAQRQQAAQRIAEAGSSGAASAADEKERKREEKERKRKEKRGEKRKAMLSFDVDGEEEEDTSARGKGKANGNGNGNGKEKSGSPDEEASTSKKPKLTKNPSLDTSFLPDRDREARERLEREELRKEWMKKQEVLKKEMVEITYSYWDGSGHRRSVECKKGESIAQFLEKCRQQFPELRGISVDNLMYIKEDLIIPHHYTFYDFIVNKARGKSGPLFSFDVHDDVRMLHDATKERDESHAGKVVERSWYQRSKHIFPASRWEVYDPDKDYGAYKIA